MIERPPFNPLQAQQVAEAFNAAGVDYLFIGKSGAILLGYPGTTQDVEIFPAKSEEKRQTHGGGHAGDGICNRRHHPSRNHPR